MTEWKQRGVYEVSNDGMVMNQHGKIMQPYLREGYERLDMYVDGERHVVSVHRMVAQLFIPNPLGLAFVDHKDGNRRNNAVKNMRWATANQNAQNAGSRGASSTSKFKGVGWHVPSQKWRAQIAANGVNRHVGLFTNEVDAARAYNAAANRLHGEFAWLNDV